MKVDAIHYWVLKFEAIWCPSNKSSHSKLIYMNKLLYKNASKILFNEFK